VQLGVLDVVDQCPGQLGHQRVVEVVALVDQVFVQFAQRVLREVVADADRALFEFRLDLDLSRCLRSSAASGTCPGGNLENRISRFFLRSPVFIIPPDEVLLRLGLHDLQALEKIQACWNW
jgi:hypothetical protein